MTDIRDEILQKIFNSISISSDGIIQREGSQIVDYRKYVSLLLDPLTEGNNEIHRKLNKMRFHFYSEGNDLQVPDFHPIWAEMKKDNDITFQNFKQKLDTQLNTIKRETKCTTFDLYYPLNIDTDTKVKSITLEGITLELEPYENIKSLFEHQKAKDDLMHYQFDTFIPEKHHYIKITLWARNGYYAENVGSKYAFLLTSFITFLKHYRHSHVTWGILKKGLAELRPKYIFISNRVLKKSFFACTKRDMAI